MCCKIFSCIFVFLSISSSSYAEGKTIKIATLEDYAPFCMTVGKFQSDQIIPVGKDVVGF